MKSKLLFSMSLFLIIMLIAFSVGCGGKTNNPPSTQQNTSTSSNKTFTLAELAKYNGQNGNPAYVAVNGIVYDVTNSREWRNGSHQGQHTAGVDLTQQIGNSPHGSGILSRLPIVGKLQQ